VVPEEVIPGQAEAADGSSPAAAYVGCWPLFP
jgi:hypothetical protein